MTQPTIGDMIVRTFMVAVFFLWVAAEILLLRRRISAWLQQNAPAADVEWILVHDAFRRPRREGDDPDTG